MTLRASWIDGTDKTHMSHGKYIIGIPILYFLTQMCRDKLAASFNVEKKGIQKNIAYKKVITLIVNSLEI
jgi:hypothetical protein